MQARKRCNMIARVWSAQTTQIQASDYVEHLKSQVLPSLRTTDGFEGAMLLQRSIRSGIEILVITFWQSVDAIRGFAGDDLEGAVIADEAATLLTQFDRRVRHYEVVVKHDG